MAAATQLPTTTHLRREDRVEVIGEMGKLEARAGSTSPAGKWNTRSTEQRYFTQPLADDLGFLCRTVESQPAGVGILLLEAR